MFTIKKEKLQQIIIFNTVHNMHCKNFFLSQVIVATKILISLKENIIELIL